MAYKAAAVISSVYSYGTDDFSADVQCCITDGSGSVGSFATVRIDGIPIDILQSVLLTNIKAAVRVQFGLSSGDGVRVFNLSLL
jgi:hypothetical protein